MDVASAAEPSYGAWDGALDPPEDLGPAGPRWFIPWGIALAVFVVTTATALAADHPDHLQTAIWSSPLPAVAMAALCRDDTGWLPRRAAITVAALVTAFLVSCLPFLGLTADTVRMAGVQVLAAFALTAAYTRLTGGEFRFPRRGLDCVTWSLLGLVDAAMLVYLGGVPGAGLGGTGDLKQDLWWLVHAATGLIYGGPIFFGLFYRPRPTHTRIRYGRAQPLIQLACIAAACIPFLGPDLPLAWLGCLPAVWIALTLTPRTAALALAAVLAVPRIVAGAAPQGVSPDELLPPLVVLESMIDFSGILAFLILVLREQTARLTDTVEAQAAREARENALLGGVFDAMTEGVLLMRPDGDRLLVTPAARSMLGRATEPAPMAWTRRYGLRSADGTELADDVVARLGDPPDDEFVKATVTSARLAGASARVYQVAARSLPVAGEPATLVLVADVTASHQRKRELESFAGTVAHDLKSPLTALTLWMDLAEAELPDDPAGGRSALVQARSACGRMREMIDDYLAYTVTREGMLRPCRVDLEALARDTAAVHGVGEPAPTFVIDAPYTVRADPALARQLMTNLLGNAVKYARPGEPAHVTVRAVADPEPGWVKVSVADRGLGIDPADAETIFQPFARTAKGARAQAGIGLGLALCQAIVDRHGGRIAAERNAQGGTTVEFTLPSAHSVAPMMTVSG